MPFFIAIAVALLIASGIAYAARRTMHPPVPRPEAGKITVAAIGDSNTYGAGVLLKGRRRWSYPAQLARLLGDSYQVLNYGLNRRTLQRDGDWPYAANRFAEASLRARADIVLIMLGTNDARGGNWNADAYESELADLAIRYRAGGRSAVYLLTPPVAFPNRRGVSERIVAEEVAPIVRRVAARLGLPLIDVFAVTEQGVTAHPDGIHLDAEASRLVAEAVAAAIAPARSQET
ncbi:GDSL-type esterase/lipase family protein [Microbacterium hydrocarbonoxydans]|uniref:GDSL-type esterase/lipase family protein n=1 Tax=Microbacterium hydrocarbonoxydans TaxID=273678 RepID=UPI0007BC635C|nr:GDSL-type esterase/lipase family protein [Microbacterium hydrocarbonoxydans]GAT71757.1 lysophospholipase L1 and related esterase [Microbacterium sp. HM58-2]